MKRTAVAVLCLCLAFAAGLAVPRSTPAPIVRPAADAPSSPVMPVPTHADGAYNSELASTKTQLAICLAYRAPAESSAAPAPTPAPMETLPEWDHLTARLVREGKTNTELVIVQLSARPFRFRAYPPGAWPPPEGPPPGARITSRRIDGGTEEIAADGGVRVLRDADPDALPWGLSSRCPCPKGDAGAEASP